jgi:hypothetical protein
MDAAYTDKLDGRITEEFWQRKQDDWQTEELKIKSLISGLNEDRSEEHLLDLQDFITLAKGLFSISYAETCRTGQIAEKSTFELLYREP